MPPNWRRGAFLAFSCLGEEYDPKGGQEPREQPGMERTTLLRCAELQNTPEKHEQDHSDRMTKSGRQRLPARPQDGDTT
jgi:hypothetical protein